MRPIAVIGFGKIGQAVAAFILQSGIPVMAVDTNPDLKNIFDKKEYQTNEPGLMEVLTAAYENKSLQVTADYSKVKGAEALIITIPLMVDEEKKLSDSGFVDCLYQLAPYCENNTVIVIETSVPVGYGRNTVLPALVSKGKVHGTDFLLAHSPERIKSGTMLAQLKSIPKIVGGLTPEATEQTCRLYQRFFPSTLLNKVESIEAAELVKLAGMIYRDVNIALSNQFAQLADINGIQFADLITLINADKEANLLQPGIGVGGHCTPVYPYFLIENFKQAGLDFSIARESRRINDSMAAYAVSKVSGKVKNKKAALLGLSFRPNVKEDAFSTTYLVHKALADAGFEIVVHDAEYSAGEIESKGLQPVEDIYTTGAEVVFLITMHKQYRQIDFKLLAAKGVKYLIDGRNAFDREIVEAAGISYFGMGK